MLLTKTARTRELTKDEDENLLAARQLLHITDNNSIKIREFYNLSEMRRLHVEWSAYRDSDCLWENISSEELNEQKKTSLLKSFNANKNDWYSSHNSVESSVVCHNAQRWSIAR